MTLDLKRRYLASEEERIPIHTKPAGSRRRALDFLAVDQCSSPYHRLIWSKASMLNRFVHSRGMDIMTTLQAIGFGAMLAWTPSVVLMAWMLWETPLDVLD